MTLPRFTGVLLIAMAIFQVADLGGFADVLVTYQAGPPAAMKGLALAFVLAEGLSGAGLLRRPPPVTAALGALAVTLGWSFLALQAFVRHLALSNCGCFDVYLDNSLDLV